MIHIQQIHTVDIVLPRRSGEGPIEEAYEVPLVRRKRGAFVGMLALPGGKLDDTDDDLEEAAARECREELGLTIHLDFFQQVMTFARYGRDPRPGRWISTLFLVSSKEVDVFGATAPVDPSECSVEWWTIAGAKRQELAFDHNDLLEIAWQKFLAIPMGVRH